MPGIYITLLRLKPYPIAVLFTWCRLLSCVVCLSFFVFVYLQCFSDKLTILSTSFILVYYMCEATCLCNPGTSTDLHLPWDAGCCYECSPEYACSATCIEFLITCNIGMHMLHMRSWDWQKDHVLDVLCHWFYGFAGLVFISDAGTGTMDGFFPGNGFASIFNCTKT